MTFGLFSELREKQGGAVVRCIEHGRSDLDLARQSEPCPSPAAKAPPRRPTHWNSDHVLRCGAIGFDLWHDGLRDVKTAPQEHGGGGLLWCLVGGVGVVKPTFVTFEELHLEIDLHLGAVLARAAVKSHQDEHLGAIPYVRYTLDTRHEVTKVVLFWASNVNNRLRASGK